MKKPMPFLWSVQSWFQSEMFLSNSIDMMKNLPWDILNDLFETNWSLNHTKKLTPHLSWHSWRQCRKCCQFVAKTSWLFQLTPARYWYFVTKIVLTHCTVWRNCSSDWEKLLKFEAQGGELANFLRSLEQFIQAVKKVKTIFVFWKKLKTPKRHFEIIWPLQHGSKSFCIRIFFFKINMYSRASLVRYPYKC